MNVPQPIDDFFRLKNEHDDAGLSSLFTNDATVIDVGESKTMRDSEEIKQWIAKSISGVRLQTDIRDCKEVHGEWIVDTVMTGDFKASPARFEYSISLKGNKISKLRVEFRG